jgi:ABC-type uncharacterized transport system ATPase subunit
VTKIRVVHSLSCGGAVRFPRGRDFSSGQPGNLSHGQKQWLEIGMLPMQDPKLLLRA